MKGYFMNEQPLGPESPDDLAKAIKEKAEELDNSALLDVHRWSDYSEVNDAVDFLYKQLSELPEFSGNEKLQKKHLKVVVLDLYVKRLEDPAKYVSYDRMKAKYKAKGSRYNKLHISPMTITIVDGLRDLDYLEHVMGHYGGRSGRTSHISRMRSKDTLINVLCDDFKVTPAMVARARNTECIILRDKNKKEKEKKKKKQADIEYVDTPETKRMRKEVTAYNNLLRKSFIDIPSYEKAGIPSKKPGETVTIDFAEKFVRRIFNNGSWEDGGRYYGGWWQRIPKEWRKEIRIWGSPTIEIDYSGLHVVLLYAIENVYCSAKEVYDLPKYSMHPEIRGLTKQILLTAINAADRSTAISAIQYDINLNPDDYGWVNRASLTIEDIIDEFEVKHSAIRKYFYSGYGVTLQKIDSRIAEFVINDFTAKGYGLLCIHDSFITSALLSSELKDVMRRAFDEVLDQLGTYAAVDTKSVGMDKQEWNFWMREEPTFSHNTEKLPINFPEYGSRQTEAEKLRNEGDYYGVEELGLQGE
jgi:hypothetical protein